MNRTFQYNYIPPSVIKSAVSEKGKEFGAPKEHEDWCDASDNFEDEYVHSIAGDLTEKELVDEPELLRQNRCTRRVLPERLVDSEVEIADIVGLEPINMRWILK